MIRRCVNLQCATDGAFNGERLLTINKHHYCILRTATTATTDFLLMCGVSTISAWPSACAAGSHSECMWSFWGWPRQLCQAGTHTQNVTKDAAMILPNGQAASNVQVLPRSTNMTAIAPVAASSVGGSVTSWQLINVLVWYDIVVV